MEADNTRFAELTAIEPERIRPDSRGECLLVKQIDVKLLDFKEELTFLLIPIQRHEAIDFLECFDLLGE